MNEETNFEASPVTENVCGPITSTQRTLANAKVRDE